ncbi:sugar transferase [Clostridium perfringens]|uniref:sugar transferase n=1 Tax=Clostridium perfringens TaxID=1502 RepID=UPI0018E43E34|nr:sugar transferase [Clostridium perfringens]MBI5984222.1 sugar transferase [Clostridium perfringens]
MYEKFLKRFLDFTLSLCGLIALSPILIVLIILGIIFMRGNPFFIQKRAGKNEKIFNLIKFRTMDNRKDKQGNLLPDAVRLNKYGRILRKTSFDELPELFNILKGDMSIIGPRPLLLEYLPYYTKKEKHRHDVRPGLTGLAQVNGRSFVSWKEIFEYDLEYVNNISLKKDIQIIFSTVNKVLRHKDIADVSESFVGEDGKRHFIINGIEYVLHQPLNVERKENGNKTSISGDM